MAAAALIAGCGTAGGQAADGQLPIGAYEVIDITGAGQPAGTGVDTAHITLTFGPGTLAVATGCNTMTGRASLDGDLLTVSDSSTTDLPCTEGFVAVQEWWAAFLDARPAVTDDGALLTLTTTRTTIQLRPAGPAAPGTAPGSGSVPHTA